MVDSYLYKAVKVNEESTVPEYIRDTRVQRIKTKFRHLGLFRGLAAAQLGCSVGFLALGISGFAFRTPEGHFGYYRWMTGIGTGLWVGVFSALAASLGLAASFHTRRRCRVMLAFVLTILAAALFVPCLLLFSSSGLDSEIFGNSHNLEREHDMFQKLQASDHKMGVDHFRKHDEEYAVNRLSIDTYIAMHVLAIVTCVVHLMSAITSLSLICFNWSKGIGGCCDCCAFVESDVRVEYAADGDTETNRLDI